MEALNNMGDILADYKQNGVRVAVEFPPKELWKLGVFVALTTICVVLAYLLLKGIFSAK